MMGEGFNWGEPISVVTREDLIADGQIIELEQSLVTEAGYKHPVGVTPGVFAIINAPSRTESLTGRSWDVLAVGMMYFRAWVTRLPSGREVALPIALRYRLTFSRRNHDLVLRFDGESFLVTLPHED